MRITFDPTNPTEAAAVRRMLAEAPEPRAICDTFRAPELRLDPPPSETAVVREAPEATEPEQAATPPDRDAAGLPWDARIHSGTRALIADGTWRKRRGVDEEVVAQVEAELRALVAIPPPADPVEVFKPDAAPAPVAPPPPPAPPAPVAPPPPPAAPAAGEPASFAELMVWLSPRLADKSVTHEQVRAAVVDAGLASVENLLARPDLVGAVYRRLAQ